MRVYTIILDEAGSPEPEAGRGSAHCLAGDGRDSVVGWHGGFRVFTLNFMLDELEFLNVSKRSLPEWRADHRQIGDRVMCCRRFFSGKEALRNNAQGIKRRLRMRRIGLPHFYEAEGVCIFSSVVHEDSNI